MQACKDEGNRNFATGDYETAIACYSEGMRYLPEGNGLDSQRAILYANRAACFLQQGNNGEALYDCDRSLEYNPAYVKALGRRAMALEKLEKLDESLRGSCPLALWFENFFGRISNLTLAYLTAYADLERWLEIEPSSRQACEAKDRIKQCISDRDEKLKVSVCK